MQYCINKLTDPKRSVRSNAAIRLGKLRDERAIIPLIQSLQDSWHNVRLEAARALNKFGNSAVTPLLNILVNKNFRIQIEVVYLLNWIKDRGALGQLGIRETQIINPLVKTLWDPSSFNRAAAAKTLMKLDWTPGDVTEKVRYFIAKREWDELMSVRKSAIPILLQILENECNLVVRREVAERFGILVGALEAPQPVLSKLFTNLKKGTKIQRRTAALALAGIQKHLKKSDKAIKSALRTALHDPAWEVRGTALTKLHRHVNMTDALLDPLWEVRGTVLTKLYRHVKLILNRSSGYTEQDLLASHKDPALLVAALLIEIKDKGLFYECSETLVKLVGDLEDISQVLPILHEALTDEDWSVREGAIVALSTRVNEIEDLEHLVPILFEHVEETKHESRMPQHLVEVLVKITPRLENPSIFISALEFAMLIEDEVICGYYINWPAAEALLEIATNTKTPSLYIDALIRGFVSAIGDTSEHAQYKIAHEVWNFITGLEEPLFSLFVTKIEPLFDYLVWDNSLDIKSLEALIEKFNDPSFIVKLILKNEREWIFGELGKITAKPFIPLVIHELKTDHESATIALIEFGKLGLDDLVQDGLVQTLEDTDPSMRSRAVWALSEISFARAIPLRPLLTKVLNDRDPEVRETVVDVLENSRYDST